jgi:hypothetical protein
MKKGAYRYYFHIGNLGFKFPRYNSYNGNPFLGFLCGIIMNVLERKRYKYYVEYKSMKQWGGKWKYNWMRPILCPCYFSFFGLVNIYKHLPVELDWEALCTFGHRVKDIDEEYLWEQTAHLVINDLKPENFRCDKNGNLYVIDYGDFSLGGYNRTCVLDIDYK